MLRGASGAAGWPHTFKWRAAMPRRPMLVYISTARLRHSPDSAGGFPQRISARRGTFKKKKST